MIKKVTKKLTLYERFKPTGIPAGFGWHSPEGVKKLKKQGFKFIKAKKQ